MFGDCIEKPVVPKFYISTDTLGSVDIAYRGAERSISIWPDFVLEKMSRLCVVRMWWIGLDGSGALDVFWALRRGWNLLKSRRANCKINIQAKIEMYLHSYYPSVASHHFCCGSRLCAICPVFCLYCIAGHRITVVKEQTYMDLLERIWRLRIGAQWTPLFVWQIHKQTRSWLTQRQWKHLKTYRTRMIILYCGDIHRHYGGCRLSSSMTASSRASTT